MNVIDLERHARRVAACFQVSGDDIVGVQLPPGFDRVGRARGAPRAADDTPDGLVAGGVPRFLTDALGERVVLRIAGHVGERQNRDGRHAETRRRRRSDDATVAVGLPAVKYQPPRPPTTMSAASAAATG